MRLDEKQEPGPERFRLAELVERHERNPQTLEEAKRADLARVSLRLTELSRIPQDDPEYLRVQRVVGDFEEFLDQMIEYMLDEGPSRGVSSGH